MATWLAVIAVLSAPLPAEAQRFRLTRLGLEDGLSQAGVYSLEQDVEGFLWVGTQNGLNRYDGRSFRFQWRTDGQPSPVSFGYIRTLFVDSAGHLWVGVDSHGLFLFRRSTEEFEPIPFVSTDGSRRPAERVWDFTRHGDRLYVATSQGLGVVDMPHADSVVLRHDTIDAPIGCGTEPTALWTGSSTDLWVGTSTGCVLSLDATDTDGDRLVADLDGAVDDISSAAHGGVWVTAEGHGALLFEEGGESISVPYTDTGPMHQATEVLVSRDGDTWIATSEGLGWLADGEGLPTWFSMGPERDGQLPHPYVASLFEDRQGVVWVGTWNGLVRVSPFRHGLGFIPIPVRPNGGVRGGVVAIQRVDAERLRLGMIGGTLALSSLNGVEYEIEHDELADVYSLASGPNGDLWVATHGTGVFRRSTEGWRTYRAGVTGRGGIPDDRVTAIEVDRTGAVWAGTRGRGLALYDSIADRFDPFPGPEDRSGYAEPYIWPIVEDGEGALWFAANGPQGAIYRLNPARTEFSTYVTGGADRPNAGRILTLHVSGDSIIWFGTQGAGLGRLAPSSGALRFYTTADGLPHNTVVGILEDRSEKLWISTNGGLARFDPATGRSWIFRERSGIQANRFHANASLELPDGTLLFGGPNGVTVLRPWNIVPREDPPPVALTAFRVRGRERADINHSTAQQGIDLEPDENFFTVEFAALDFTDASLNAYRYRLDDLDPDWIQGEEGNTASYTSVPAGDYVFRVQARNSEGVWNRDGLRIPIVVHPPYYATWWFQVAVAATLVLAGWVLYSARLRQLARVRAMRLQIAGELHDDIGANLSAIALKSELLQKPRTSEEKRQGSLGDIERLARETTQKVREMIWVVKEEHDTLVGLIDHMRDAAQALLGGVAHYTFRVEDEVPDRPIPMEVRQDVYQVFKEMLQNVLKHSGATEVGIEIGFSRSHLVVTVVDNGVGFDESRVESGNGLMHMRQRAGKHGGVLELESSAGKGVRVSLTVEIP